MAASEDAKLERFLQWLQANGAELRGSTIKYCGQNKRFGVFSTSGNNEDGIVMVVPLDLAITPMRVLQDPNLGPKCRALFDEGHVDDRFLVMLFLTVERMRPDSPWKPYFDMLPSTFGNPLWFTDEELAELKGTTLFRATLLQRKSLRALYEEKVKSLVEEILCCGGGSNREYEVGFEDFLWANSIFWSRALNIPLPRSYIFPEPLGGQDNNSACEQHDSGTAAAQTFAEMCDKTEPQEVEKGKGKETSNSIHADTVWVEGLVPGIDFCNHGLKAAATWEVDATGSTTGVPTSMYLMLAGPGIVDDDSEIFISYGNKGNEELLYLYGFVMNSNQDDYVMVHYPMEAIQSVPFADAKARLLEAQKAELRCLLPKSLLDHGFFAEHSLMEENGKKMSSADFCNYSWSGRRKVPSYINKLVFPQDFLTTLRTVAMQENELSQVSELLEELVGPREGREPSDREVQAAVWEACGDFGALELLVDLLRVKMMELEEGSGTEGDDTQLLDECQIMELEDLRSKGKKTCEKMLMSRNQWSSIVYRRGQKQLTGLFLKEAEHALDLCSRE